LYCDDNEKTIFLLTVKMSNEYAKLLLHDRVQSILIDAFYYVSPQSIIGQKLSHILSVLYFAQGEHTKVRNIFVGSNLTLTLFQTMWKPEQRIMVSIYVSLYERYVDVSCRSNLNKSDVIAMRSFACQEAIVFDDEKTATECVQQYSSMIGERFHDVFGAELDLPLVAVDVNASSGAQKKFRLRRHPPSKETEEGLQTFLLSEAQGGVRVQPRLTDLVLATTDLSKPMGAAQHFDLGICLSKLGLYDLAQHHVALSATPWDPMYHRLRYTLSLPHVYDSMRALARSIDNFEQQIEQYILRDALRSPAVKAICNSFADSGMVLGVLPLLHLAGYSAPRHEILMGHSPVPMPVLLSEFYSTMCSLDSKASPYYMPQLPTPFPVSLPLAAVTSREDGTKPAATSDSREKEKKARNRRLRVGVVSGSFDSTSGRVMVGKCVD
jgi:hypothetical protein